MAEPAEQSNEISNALGRLSAADLTSDPHGTLAKFRETSPVFPVQSGGYRFWVVSRYDDVRTTLADSSVVRDLIAHRGEINSRCLADAGRSGTVPPWELVPPGARSSFFHRDGHQHHWLKTLVGNAFTPKNLSRMAVEAQRIAGDLLNSITCGEPIDLVSRYARPFASTCFCELVGIPSSRENLLGLVLAHEAFTLQEANEMDGAVGKLLAWTKDVIEKKRTQPGADLCTDLLKLHEASSLSEDELTSTYIVLMIGGMEPATVIESGIFSLLAHPDQLAIALADPEFFVNCVDETVRYEDPFRFLVPRFTTAPLKLSTVTIPAGELIVVSPAAGNRDPGRFQDPDKFDITRTTTGHLGFGHGPHKCPGAQLGKIEVATAIRMFFERFPATRLVDAPDEASWIPGKHQRRLSMLHVIPA